MTAGSLGAFEVRRDVDHYLVGLDEHVCCPRTWLNLSRRGRAGSDRQNAEVIRPYRDLLRRPGALSFSSAGLLARLPISMLGIGIVLLVSDATGSYASAGLVAGTYTVVQALASPQLARLVDRYGQARVMRPALGVHVCGVVLLVLAAWAQAPSWTFYVAAVVAGATIGSVGALVRARWNHALGTASPGHQQALHTAFSLESVLDEVVFIVGPVVVAVLATEVGPGAGLLAAAAAALVGGLLLFAQRATEPPVSGERNPPGSSVLRIPGVVVLAVAFVFVGGIFGSAEVVAIAFTEERGRPGAAGWVLASFAAGSLIAGVGYGVVHWKRSAGRRFVGGVVMLSVGILPFALVTSIPLLAAVMFVAGFAISPMIISGTSAVQELVPARRLTEGLTYISTALGIGVAIGAAASGQVIDDHGARTAFAVSVAAGGLATVTGLIGTRWLQTSDAAG